MYGKENLLENLQPVGKEKNDQSDVSDLHKKVKDEHEISEWCDVQKNENPDIGASTSLIEDNPPLFFSDIYAEIETSVHGNVEELFPMAPFAVGPSTDVAIGASSTLSFMPPLAPTTTDAQLKIVKTQHATIDQPNCAERTLALILAFLKAKQCRSEGGQEVNAEESVVSFANVEDYIKLLEDQIAEEDLGATIRTSSLLRRLRGNIPLLTDISRPYEAKDLGILEQLDSEVFRALRAIQPLDMNLLVECIERTMQADTSNKNVILLLGCTGAGKSTITHYLAGSKMVEKPVLGKKNLSFIGKAKHKSPLSFDCSLSSDCLISYIFDKPCL